MRTFQYQQNKHLPSDTVEYQTWEDLLLNVSIKIYSWWIRLLVEDLLVNNPSFFKRSMMKN